MKRVPAGGASQVLVESYAVNERMSQLVLEHLDPEAWRARLPGGKGRTIAAIFAHITQHPPQMDQAFGTTSEAPLAT